MMLRLVPNNPCPTEETTTENVVDFDAEAHRVFMLMQDAEILEHQVGKNPLSTFLREHKKRPDKAQASGMAKLLGWRIRADDGRLYPKETKAQKDLRLSRAAERKAHALRLEYVVPAIRAIEDLANADPVAFLEHLSPTYAEELAATLEQASKFLSPNQREW